MADPQQNGATPPVPVAQMVQPRPIPTAWEAKVVEFVATDEGGTEKRIQQVELRLYSATGVHVTYWDPSSVKRLAGDLRGAGAEAAQKASGIWTPPQPGDGPNLIVPPTTGG